MISGYFASDGSPYVKARVRLPRLGVVGEVHFLVDTGTDTTVVHPYAASDLRCPFDELVNPIEVTSAGGLHTYYPEEAIVSFYADGTRYDYRTDLHIGKPSPVTEDLDSLLGRDILNELRMEYDPRQEQLQFHQ